MQSYAEYQLAVVNDRRSQELQEAAEARLVARPEQPIRLSIGQSIVRIGHRLAGAPSFALVARNSEMKAGPAQR